MSSGLLSVVVGVGGLVASSVNAADYERDIKPILEKHCYACHSRLKQKADLRLDAGALIHQGGKHGPVVVIGKADQSPLLERVRSKADDERMPPEGKPLPADKIALLEEWVATGAKFPSDEAIPPIPAQHWSFQLVRRAAVPTIKNAAAARNAIDHFVMAVLEKRGWQPAPTAEPRALLRRIHLDLTGLPPFPAEQERFLKQPSPQALDAVIDELLSRPTYGERWARHWLDVVRYADSNGYERDAEKPFVWRYRDYVIQAFNADKPFNRFVTEQLGGDELAEPSAETMIATTYLRLGHWDDEPADPLTDRFDQLDDIVSTSSQALLGLTLGCARCHDHKFEPLSTRDYYSMVAVFSPLERPRDGRTEQAVPVGTRRELAALAERNRQLELLRKDALALAPEELARRTNALRAATPDLPLAYTWREPSPNPPPSFVMLRGSATRPGEPVQPAIPAILARANAGLPTAPGEHTSLRRLRLARWLTDPENPLTARVIVNRVWQQHFGQGLVRTPNDFGLMGEPPTHPELLDWLAYWFVHDANWSLKRLHRLILASNTWRMSTRSNPAYAAVDPENRLLWRMPHRRLSVEAIRDSMLAVSGQLNSKMFGSAMKPAIPAAAIEANTDKESSWKASDATETSRRTIYAFIKRGLVVPMLEVLDLADTVNSCPQRQVTTVAPQALSLFNGDFVNEQSRHFANRLQREAGSGRGQIELAWRMALCRPPSSTEMAAMANFLQQEASALVAEALTEKRELSKAEAEHVALRQMCRVILNLNEFVYVE